MTRQERIARRQTRRASLTGIKIELEDVKLTFTVKDMSLYLGNKKVADLEKNKEAKLPNVLVKYVNPANSDDFVNDYFYDIDEKNLKNEKHEIKTVVDISEVYSYGDSYVDSSGSEWSYLAVDQFSVFWGDTDITELLSREENSRITEIIEKKLNEDYKPKYLGTHRTY